MLLPLLCYPSKCKSLTQMAIANGDLGPKESIVYDGSTQLEQVQLTIQAVILSHRRAASRYFTGLSLYLSLKADLTILH